MESLKNIDLLVSDVFYRSYHVLDYIEKNLFISNLDREAISATIIDALVYKKLIDPKKQSLDFDNLCICDDLDHYCYEEQPFVTSIPLEIKEKMRTKCFSISGGIPASVFYAKPAGKVSFCIYDMNTVFSAFFDNFIFLTCDYNSPTREGIVAKDRPFIEVSINGTNYLVDALTKRIFRSDFFKEKFDLKEKYSIAKKDFDLQKQEYYNEQVMENVNYAMHIMLFQDFSFNLAGNMSEMVYEVDKSREFFSGEFEKLEQIRKDMEVLNEKSFSFSKKRK